jgi:hypothetical protein
MEASVAATPASEAPPEQLSEAETAALAALVVALLGGMAGAAFVGYASSLLAPLGISAAAVAETIALIGARELPAIAGEGVAARQIRRTAYARRAAYLLNASRRLDVPEDRHLAAVQAERRYLAAHLDAERLRIEAAVRVDEAAGRYGLTLGWRSVRDERTTRGCRQAHGRNFRADRPPTVEGQPVFPGMLHGGACRCEPGPPWPDGELMG